MLVRNGYLFTASFGQTLSLYRYITTKRANRRLQTNCLRFRVTLSSELVPLSASCDESSQLALRGPVLWRPWRVLQPKSCWCSKYSYTPSRHYRCAALTLQRRRQSPPCSSLRRSLSRSFVNLVITCIPDSNNWEISIIWIWFQND